MVGGWVAKRGRRDQLLALIINGISLVHALSEELEQDVCTHSHPIFSLGMLMLQCIAIPQLQIQISSSCPLNTFLN
jgi:hypothetical protein